MATDGQISLVRTSKANIQTLLLIRGTRLAYKKEPWVASSEPVARVALHYEGSKIVGHVSLPSPHG